MKQKMFSIFTILGLTLNMGYSNSSIASEEPSATAQPIVNSEAETQPNDWSVEAYGEMYKSITGQKPIQFNRFLLGRSQIGSNNGSVKVGVESYQSNDSSSIPTQPIWSLSLGYYYSLFDSLKLVLMMRSENFNQTSKQETVIRTGMYGGVFKFLNEEKGLYFDSYYDLFLQNSTLSSIKSESQFNQKFLAMGSASLRVGWRWNTPVRSLFIDPLMLEVRGYTNTKFQEAGDPYSIFNMGPRILYYPTKPPIYASFFLSRSYNLEPRSSYSIAPTWALFSFGGDF